MLTSILQMLVHLGLLGAGPGVEIFHGQYSTPGSGYSIVVPGDWELAPILPMPLALELRSKRPPAPDYMYGVIAIGGSPVDLPVDAINLADDDQCRTVAAKEAEKLGAKSGGSRVIDGPTGRTCLARITGAFQSGVQVWFHGAHDGKQWMFSCTSDGRDTKAERLCMTVLASFRWDSPPTNGMHDALPR